MSGEEDRMLEQRLQADFSKGLVSSQGPLAMGLCYIRHLAHTNPLRAAGKCLVMAYRYGQYVLRLSRGKEDLHDVFSIYEGMPVDLVEQAANRLTLNPAFIEKADAHCEEHNLDHCLVDICTRDASCLVEAFIDSHRDELEEAGITIRSVRANRLDEQEGRFTGNAETPILLRTKPLYLDSRLAYLTGKDEYRIYKGLLPNIVQV